MREPFRGDLRTKLSGWLSGRFAQFTVSLLLSGCLDGSPTASRRKQSDQGQESTTSRNLLQSQ